MAARLASKQSDEESLKTLEKLRDELKEVDIEQNSIEGTRIGRLMHQEIIKAASNQLLSDIYVKLSYLSALTTNIAKHNVRTEQASKAHHIAIMDAIILGDAENSEHYMRQHLKVTCRNLIEILYPQFVSAITEGIDTGFAL